MAVVAKGLKGTAVAQTRIGDVRGDISDPKWLRMSEYTGPERLKVVPIDHR
jgi:hypothetical protein